jgi:hypothetical protein
MAEGSGNKKQPEQKKNRSTHHWVVRMRKILNKRFVRDVWKSEIIDPERSDVV